MKKAILFDLDGVLINSEVADQQVNADFIKDFNLKTDPKIFTIWIGANPNIPLWDDYILPNIALEDEPDTFEERLMAYRKVKRAQWDFRNIIYPDTKEALKKLKESGLELACCSSSSLPYIEKALGQTDIEQYFSLVISGRDFKNSKPAPDIYLYALNHYGISADEALVVEDSPYGIKAGKAANITVLARKDNVFGLNQSEADYIINSLDEVINFI